MAGISVNQMTYEKLVSLEKKVDEVIAKHDERIKDLELKAAQATGGGKVGGVLLMLFISTCGWLIGYVIIPWATGVNESVHHTSS